MNLKRGKSVGYVTGWAGRLFARAMDRRLKEIGVSSGQLPVFFALGGGGALSQKQLATFAAIEQPTMAATLSRMERDGLIVRSPDPTDGRSMLVALTPAAKMKALRAQEAVASVNATALRGLTRDERSALLTLLNRTADALETSLDQD